MEQSIEAYFTNENEGLFLAVDNEPTTHELEERENGFGYDDEGFFENLFEGASFLLFASIALVVIGIVVWRRNSNKKKRDPYK